MFSIRRHEHLKLKGKNHIWCRWKNEANQTTKLPVQTDITLIEDRLTQRKQHCFQLERELWLLKHKKENDFQT